MRLESSFSLAVVLLATTPALHAQWSADPADNLAIADRPSEQVIPLVGSTSDGGCYIAWFDLASGNYDVYLQRLDAGGVEQWPHNGMLISNQPQNSALFGWDMIVDSNDHAVLVFSDERNGGDLDIQAYRVSPAGELVWGALGVTLSNNGDFEPAPQVAEASNGDFVFVWARLPDVGDGEILMQRLSVDGVPQLAAGGVSVVTQAGESPAFVQIVPAEDGNVILSWVRDISSFLSSRHVRAAKFSPTAVNLWGGAVAVFDATSVPIAYTPQLQADGAGGALVLWHRSQSNFFNCFVQHLDADGNELFPHNGVAVSTVPNMNHLDPALAYLAATDEIIIFWNERNSAQSQWGIFGQKIAADGTRQWGGAGVTLLPVSTLYRSFPRTVPYADGAMVFLTDEPTGMFGQDQIIGLRVDGTGASVWPGSPIVISSTLSNKARLPLTQGPDGVVTLVWEDNRSGTVDVYAQNVNPDGSLGVAGNPADINRDGVVDVLDLIAIITSWGPCPGCAADVDGSGTVDVLDLIAVITGWTV